MNENCGSIPLILFEDEHLLVVNKPAGMNTHSPSQYAGEGLYEWLKNREPRWASLAIIHRLDKETSGLIVFTKSPLANRLLTAQFEKREVHKKYILLTDRKVDPEKFTARSCLIRVGDRYVSRLPHAGGEMAETLFSLLPGTGRMPVLRWTDSMPVLPWTDSLRRVQAEPLTGRTHQIRVHAADHGFPVFGDTFYGGTEAERVCLHAAEISFKHPASGQDVVFSAPDDFDADPRLAIRDALIDVRATDAFRVIHGAADGWPGLYVDRLAGFLLAQSELPLGPTDLKFLAKSMERLAAAGVYHKLLRRHVQKSSVEAASPQLVLGTAAPEEFVIRENGAQFALRFSEGYSVGLFLDQRDNRRRLLTRYVAPEFALDGLAGGETLNAFAYTCGFSVCAAKAGARVTSLDLSKKYLDWGKRNFELNGLDPARHDFIFGDVFDWMRRLAKKSRLYDAILLDPPTFSRSKEHGVFQAEKDYGELAAAALPLLKPGGVLFASTNAATLQPGDFLQSLSNAILASQRTIQQLQFIPQPPDFPLHRSEPAYLKTVWIRVG